MYSGPFIIIAAHHKAGSTYAKKCFCEISKRLHSQLVIYGHDELPNNELLSNRQCRFLLFTHARLRDLIECTRILGSGNCRILHIIRDPRTLILSACLYHLRSSEPWLAVPRDRFGGLSYQSVLKSFSTLEEKLIFEMKNGAKNAILDMHAIHSSGLSTVAVRIEELSWDYTRKTHEKLAKYLFLEQKNVDICTSILSSHSLCSMDVLPLHCTTQLCLEADLALPATARNVYREMFGCLHTTLGYT